MSWLNIKRLEVPRSVTLKGPGPVHIRDGIANAVNDPFSIVARCKGFINGHFSNDADLTGRDFEQGTRQVASVNQIVNMSVA